MENRKIAIVDDESELAQTMHEFLVDSGFEASYFTSPYKLLDQMSKEKFRIVFSDLKMPEKNGLDLFNAIVSMNLDAVPRFVLMSGHIDNSEIKGYYQQGIDEIVSKPFDLNDIVTVANFLLENGIAEETPSQIFFPVSVSDFINSSANKYDVYIKIDKKYICIAQKGQPLTQARLVQLQKKGLSNIYILQQDFLQYSGLQLKLTESGTLTRLDMEKRKRMVSHLIDVVSTSALLQENRTDILQKAIANFENVGLTLSFDTKIFEELTKMKNSDSNQLAKATMQGVLAAAIAQTWRWSTPKVQSKLIMAGLLCDIGLRELPHVMMKRRHEYDLNDVRDFETHPERSAQILESIPGMPSEIILVAKQHHENESGKGFPFKMKKEMLHPYSRIIHAVSDFLDLVLSQQQKPDPEKALSVMFDQRVIYSEQVLKGLYLVFGVSMPSRIASVQLPDKTSILV